MTADVGILVPSCDGYTRLWAPFAHCFTKYWPGCPYPTYLGSNERPCTAAPFEPVMVGRDRGYATNLLAMLEAIPHEHVLVWMDDYFLAASVVTGRAVELFQALASSGSVYARLTAAPPFGSFATIAGLFGPLPPVVRYRMSLPVVLWRKSFLQQFLQAGESAWEVETAGTSRVLGVAGFYALTQAGWHNPPFVFEHILIRGKVMRRAAPFLKREGLQDLLDASPRQTLGSHLYVRARYYAFQVYYHGVRLHHRYTRASSGPTAPVAHAGRQ